MTVEKARAGLSLGSFALLLSGCLAPVQAPNTGRTAKTPRPHSAFTAVTPAAAQVAPSAPLPAETSGDDVPPTVLAPLANLNDFGLLANGGFDPGWRVGYDTLWVVQLPPAPPGKWRKVYLGAKLGRAKQEHAPGKPSWEKRRIKGEIDISVAEEPLWPHSRRFLLAEARDIPLEGDPDNAVDGVGEARWFWVEVPLKHVSFDRPNFILLFSPSASLKGPDRAPVLAAGPRAMVLKDVNVWMNAGVEGQPPLGSAEAIKTPVNTYAPAIALKLVPENGRAVQVSLSGGPEKGAVVASPFVLSAAVTGTDVSRAWVESSTDTKKWTGVGGVLQTAPYSFTVKPASLPAGEVWLRVSATDEWENRGASDPLQVVVAERKK